MSSFGAHLIIVSDRAAAGIRPDQTAGRLLPELQKHGFHLETVWSTIVPDEEHVIVATLRALVSRPEIGLILTSGGTGVALRDRTPEATKAVIEKELPGFGELMRGISLKSTPMAAGSRALAGVAGRTLVVNLPGSPSGAVECFDAVAQVSKHVLRLLREPPQDCRPGH